MNPSGDTAALGTVALPEPEQRKSDGKPATGSLATGGALDPLIPPRQARRAQNGVERHGRGGKGTEVVPALHGAVLRDAEAALVFPGRSMLEPAIHGSRNVAALVFHRIGHGIDAARGASSIHPRVETPSSRTAPNSRSPA